MTRLSSPCPVIGMVSLALAALAGCAAPPPAAAPAAALPAAAAAAPVPPELRRLAALSLDGGAYDDARQRYARILAAAPDDGEAKLGLADALLALGDAAAARPLYEEAAASPPLRARATLGEALCEAAGGRPETALAALEEAVAGAPASDRAGDRGAWRAWNALGRVYDRQQRWDRADAAYAKAAQAVPAAMPAAAAVVQNNWGYSLLLRGQGVPAVEHLVAAVGHDAGLEAAQNNLRLALAWQGRYDDAQSGASRRGLPRVLNNLGYVAMVRGDYDKAEGLLAQAVEKSPDYYETAWRNLDRLKALHPPAAETAR